MPVSVVATTVASSTTNTVTIAEPAGVQVGDVLIAVHRAQNTRTTYPGPEGFTLVTPYVPSAADGRTQGIWTRVISNNDPRPTSYSINLGGASTRQNLVMMLVRGLDTADLVSAVVASYTGEATGPRLAVESLSADTETFQLFAAGGEVTDGNPHHPSTKPVGFTEVASLPEGTSTVGSRTALWVGYRMVPAGPTGVVESSWVWQSTGAAQSALFRPDGAQPVLATPDVTVSVTDPATIGGMGSLDGSWPPVVGASLYRYNVLSGDVIAGYETGASTTTGTSFSVPKPAGTYTVVVRAE